MKICGYEVHPAANDWPLLQGDEFDSLVESIRERGLLEPVGLFDGQILDGRNRALACQKARVDLRAINVHPKNGPWLYVIDKNAKRRHMEKGAVVLCVMAGLEHNEAERARVEKAEAAAKAAGDAKRSAAQKGIPKEQKKTEAKERARSCERGGSDKDRGPSARRAAIASMAGTSVATVGRVERFKAAAPERAKEVQEGKISLREGVGQQKLAAKAAVAEQIRAAPPPSPTGRSR